jgi:putative tryptophan/tyrosine transport system substrate-binding protein
VGHAPLGSGPRHRRIRGRAARFPGAACEGLPDWFPIVIVLVSDPVESGLVVSLARPGGNITGLSLVSEEVVAKQLELLKEAVPQIIRVAMLIDPTNPAQLAIKKKVEPAAKALGMRLQRIDVRSASDLDGAFAAALRQRADAFLVSPLNLASPDEQRIVEFAIKNRLPTMTFTKKWVETGGLMLFAPDFADQIRRTATYVDKILKGAKPGDLPIEQPTKFELVINAKTAKALGLTIPPSLLARADEVLE